MKNRGAQDYKILFLGYSQRGRKLFAVEIAKLEGRRQESGDRTQKAGDRMEFRGQGAGISKIKVQNAKLQIRI